MLTTKNPQDESFRPNLRYLAVLIRTAARGPAPSLYRFSDGWGSRGHFRRLGPALDKANKLPILAVLRETQRFM
jgi:hypothetical protein